jgi:hypothetical protein
MQDETKKPKIVETSFVQIDNQLYEQVGVASLPEARLFFHYNPDSGDTEVVEKVAGDDVIFIPPKGDLVGKGVILLPAHAKAYGSISDLVEKIDRYVDKYVDIADTFRRLVAYYVLLAWVYDNFETVPYLRVLGDFGSGKSRFQKVVGSICYKPMFCSGATTVSPIFRIIDMYKGTLVLDEGDFRFSDATVELVKILNTGYSKGMPVLRTEGDKVRMPVGYCTFGPKIIGTRKRWQDQALESRCITNVMWRSSRSDIPLHLPESFDEEALELRNELLQFRLEHYGSVMLDPSLVIPKVEPRINQIVLPLLSLIEDKEVKANIINFVKDYASDLRESRGQELGAELIRVMSAMAVAHEDLMTKEIARKLNEQRDTEQGEKPISPALVGRINASEFHFRTRKVNGLTEILWDREIADRLSARYGLETVEDVEEVEMIKEALIGDVSGQSTSEEPK